MPESLSHEVPTNAGSDATSGLEGKPVWGAKAGEVNAKEGEDISTFPLPNEVGREDVAEKTSKK